MNLREKLQSHIANLRVQNPLGDKGKEDLTSYLLEELPHILPPYGSVLIRKSQFAAMSKLDGLSLSAPSEFAAYAANVSEWLVNQGLTVYTLSDGTFAVSV